MPAELCGELERRVRERGQSREEREGTVRAKEREELGTAREREGKSKRRPAHIHLLLVTAVRSHLTHCAYAALAGAPEQIAGTTCTLMLQATTSRTLYEINRICCKPKANAELVSHRKWQNEIRISNFRFRFGFMATHTMIN